MAPIRIQHVVSFSSQDPKNRVENMCDPTGRSRPWLCGKLERNGVLKAELQLERASNICFIDVGNFGSAFIQVDVGRSSWPSDHPYVTLLPAAALMSPADSRQGNGRQCVRMFKKADFLSQAAEDSWDRLRVTCIQPFNKHCQFGLSFLRLRTAEEHTDEVSAVEQDTENHGTPEQKQSVREWLSSPSVKNTFFGQTTGQGSLGEDQRNNGNLTRAERMVTAAWSSRRSLHIDPHNNLTIQREAENQRAQLVEHSSGFISSDNKSRSPQELGGKSKTRQEQESMMTTPKRSKFASSKNLAPKYIRSSTSARTGTKKDSSTLKHSPVKSNTTDMSPTQYLPDSPEHPESVCPLCGVYFSPDYLPLHASSCLDSGSLEFSGSVGTDSMDSLPSHSPFSRDDFMLPCPLCSLRFPKDCIEQHASTCGDTIWVD